MHDVAWRGMWICVRSKDAQKQLARTSLIIPVGGDFNLILDLDIHVVSQSLMCNITHAGITMGFKTDHSLITICAALHSNQ